jgi:hypothetical protein
MNVTRIIISNLDKIYNKQKTNSTAVGGNFLALRLIVKIGIIAHVVYKNIV